MKTWLMALAFAASGIGGVAMAQQGNAPSTIVRKELLTAAIAGNKDVARVEIKQIDFAPAQRTGLHRHPCPVVGYVAHGSIRFQVDGPATFVAFYLLGAGDQKIIEMLQ